MLKADVFWDSMPFTKLVLASCKHWLFLSIARFNIFCFAVLYLHYSFKFLLMLLILELPASGLFLFSFINAGYVGFSIKHVHRTQNLSLNSASVTLLFMSFKT